MIGVVVVTHGEFSKGIHQATEMIVGEQEQFESIPLHEGADLEVFTDEIGKKIQEADAGEGVLVFVDLFGATPFNSVVRQIKALRETGTQLKIITGVNLGMLLEAISMRSFKNLETLHEKIAEIGKESIEAVSF